VREVVVVFVIVDDVAEGGVMVTGGYLFGLEIIWWILMFGRESWIPILRRI